MILVIVYVGAVLVLFLFVVMMLDVDFAELRQGFLQYLPIGAFLGIMVLTELVLVVGTWVIGPDVEHAITVADPADRAECSMPRRSGMCCTRSTSISSRPRASCCWSR
jgi:NADH-quinone oxidoreductase subunit J